MYIVGLGGINYCSMLRGRIKSTAHAIFLMENLVGQYIHTLSLAYTAPSDAPPILMLINNFE